jgi:uncharacterized protein (DUF2384 family)
MSGTFIRDSHLKARGRRPPAETRTGRKTGMSDIIRRTEASMRQETIRALALEVFGDADKAERWLHRPNRALHGITPLQAAEDDQGAREVETLLGRISHGLF